MKAAELILNGLLVGATGYTMYSIDRAIAHPYAFVASAFGLCHGLLGIFTAYKDANNTDGVAKIKEISKTIMEILPLSLVNIELYSMSASSSNLALEHGLFIIPLAFDIISKLFCEDIEDDDGNATATLKDLTILGNIASLVYLTVQEENAWYGAMAAAAFMSRYGSMALENYYENKGALFTLFFDMLFYGLTAETVCNEHKNNK